MDFTLNKYESLCKAIAESKYTCITLADYLRLIAGKEFRHYIIMRHDIDRDPARALDVATVENRYGIQGTYYFRVQKATYVPEIIDQIASFKHEIGYHYETVDKCKGDIELAKQLFGQELLSFRNKYDVETVCAHGNPLTKYDNKAIWNSMNLPDFRLLGEAFLALDYRKFAYFSDSGRTWLNIESQKMPGKDSVKTAFDHISVKSTDDIITIIQGGQLPNICILSHPERWQKSLIGFSARYFLDMAFSWGKVAIYAYRKGDKPE